MSTAEEKRWYEAVHSLGHCVLCTRFGVQVSHSNQERGMGQKSAPWDTAALCQQCHYELDNGRDLTQQERRALHDMAIRRTHSALIKAGRLALK